MKATLSSILILFSFLSFTQLPPGAGRRGGMDFNNMPKDGRVFGIVIDSETKKGLEFATISMRHLKDSTKISGGIADVKGKFDITDLMYGPWEITISFMGYEDKVLDVIRITPQSKMVDVGQISVSPSATQLDEVDIETGGQQMVELSIDKKVFNVDKNLTSSGGGADEVLNNVPGVEVDMDGQITLRGNSNVTVLIDGKPSSLTGGDRQAILEQIPASAIESIEVITNPSAKYDPDGMSGIINVVLKKNKLQGINGNVSLNYVVPSENSSQYSGNASLNYRNKKLNLFSNYSYRYSNMWRQGTNHRELFSIDSANIVDQTSFATNLRENHTVKAGADYSFTPKSTLTLSGTFNTKLRGNNNSEDFKTYTESTLIDWYNRSSDESDVGYSYDASLGFEQSFNDPKRKLTTLFNYSYGLGQEINNLTQNAYNIDGSLNNTAIPYTQVQPNNDYNVNILHQLDYIHPTEKGKIEAGTKYTNRIIDTDYQFYYDSTGTSLETSEMVENEFLANHFNYDEKIFAAYGIYARKINEKIEYQLGLRAEQALTASKLVETNEVFNNDYFSLYPSGFLTYKMNPKNDIGFSYSRRVNRPGFWSLNPFIDYSDPNNIRTGNPFLRPEYINSYELTYTKYIGKNVLTSSLYYKQTYDMIQRLVTVDSAGISTLTWTNYAGAENIGLELIFMLSPAKWVRMTGSFNIYQNKVDGSNLDQDYSNTAFNNFGRLNMTFSPMKNLDIQVSGFYRGRMEFAIGHMDPMYSTDLAVKYSMLNKKLDASIRLSDVFNTRQFSISTGESYYVREILRKRQSRFVQLGLSYRFGKMEVKGDRRRGSGGGDMDGDDGGVM